jgi:tetratricopeptide (TPR) repeat protein
MADRKMKETELTPGEALALFEKAAKEDPNNAQAQLNLGCAQYATSHWDAAFETFQNAARLAPALDHAHYYLGVLYAKRGDKGKAREELEKVVNGGAHVILKNQARIQLNALG